MVFDKKNHELSDHFVAASRKGLILAAAALFALFIHLGLNHYISDSEIWSVTLGRNLIEDWSRPWVLSRPFFYGLIGLFVSFADRATAIFELAQIAGTAWGIAIIFLTFLIAKAAAQPQRPAANFVPWLAVFALLSNTAFLNQGFRIRSDLLAAALSLFALLNFIRVERGLSGRLYRRLWLLPLLATPKAILLIAPSVVFITRPDLKTSKRWLTIFGFAALVLFPIYFPSLRYFIDSFGTPQGTSESVEYFSCKRFYFVIRALKMNWLFFLLFAARAFTVLVRLGEEPGEKKLILFACLQTVLLLLAPEKYPFLIAAVLPTLAIQIGLFVQDIWRFSQVRSAAVRFAVWFVALGMVGVVFANATAWAKICRDEDGNGEQLAMIEALDHWMDGYPQAVYFDGIGILPNRAKIRKFLGPTDPLATQGALEYVLGRSTNDSTGQKVPPPDLIFLTAKLRHLEPDMSLLLEKEYTDLGSGVFARWEPLPEGGLKCDRIGGELDRILKIHGLSSSTAMERRVRFLLREPQGAAETHDLSVDQLCDKASALGGRTIEKISVFTPPEKLPAGLMPVLFRFDAHY